MFRAAAQPPAIDTAPPLDTAPIALDNAPPREAAPISLDARVGALEHSLITWALKACEGNVSRAAERLQIKRSTLQDRMKRYQLDPASALLALPSAPVASA